MKKGISLALCAALCLGLLAGCGASSQAGTSGSAPAEKKGTLNLYTWEGMLSLIHIYMCPSAVRSNSWPMWSVESYVYVVL